MRAMMVKFEASLNERSSRRALRIATAAWEARARITFSSSGSNGTMAPDSSSAFRSSSTPTFPPVRSCSGTARTERVEYSLAASNRRLSARVGHVHDLARLGDVAGEARLGQPQGLGLEPLLHRDRTELLLEEVVLHDREAEVIAFPDEHGAGLGPCKPACRVENSLEQGIQVVLCGEGEPDIEELLDELAAIGHRLRTH